MTRSNPLKKFRASTLFLTSFACWQLGWAQEKPTSPATQKCCEEHKPKGESGFDHARMENFARRADKLLAPPSAGKAAWGILVVDGESGEAIYEQNADKYFVPASNMKLFTTALALAQLGSDYRFHTTLETRGTISAEGRLDGDLVLVGRGDPNLSNRKFPFVKEPETDGPPEKVLLELVDGIVAKGVREITGDVVADDSYFPRERYPTGWEVDDMVWSYGAAVSAIVVNDNTVTLTLEPGAQPGYPAIFSIAPWTAEFTVRNDAITSPAGMKADLTLTREPGAAMVVIRGIIPAKSEPRKLVLAIEEPAEQAATLLKRLLEERGVRVRGVARARHDVIAEPATAFQILSEHVSVPLAQAVVAINKMSENLHTEMLLRAAARQSGVWSTPEELAKFPQAFYSAAGIVPGDVIQADGSGLSRHDLVTPRAVVTLLQYASRQPWSDTFYASLPVAGVDGTLMDRFKNTPAEERIHAKTGSVEHVHSLSGFAELPGGRRLIFSILANNQGAKNHEATAPLDAICVAMMEELGQASPPTHSHDYENQPQF